MADTVEQAAERLREAQHVAAVVGGRAARAELDQARTAMKEASGLTHNHS